MSSRDKHFVSVVIPTIMSDHSLEQLKMALQQQTRPADEIYFIHDDQRRGAAWARNKGVSRCNGDLVAFLDDDCLPPPNWLAALINAIDKYQADGAGGTYEETDPLLIDRRKRQKYPDTEMEDTQGLVGTGGNLMFTRTWLDQLAEKDGYVFNEAFRISQDWEFIIRSRQQNIKLIYIPVRVKHLKKLNAIAYLKLQFGRGKGVAGLYLLQRELNKTVITQKSLIWGKNNSHGGGWLIALWRKGLGPFDISSFERKRDFIVFWLGEKIQGFGFLWYIFSIERNSKN
jgi:glycosyltransferase involved in cell wall biosynthesis